MAAFLARKDQVASGAAVVLAVALAGWAAAVSGRLGGAVLVLAGAAVAVFAAASLPARVWPASSRAVWPVEALVVVLGGCYAIAELAGAGPAGGPPTWSALPYGAGVFAVGELGFWAWEKRRERGRLRGGPRDLRRLGHVGAVLAATLLAGAVLLVAVDVAPRLPLAGAGLGGQVAGAAAAVALIAVIARLAMTGARGRRGG
ncbi:MAG: hypothetical protein ACYDH5_19925 [Acidimicrobiales bacterium]